MRVLHAAAMPFPTHQGTQAAVRHIASAIARAGHATRLLTYAGRAFEDDAAAPYTLVRAPDRPRVASLRSGPSFSKVALDVTFTAALRDELDATRPDVIVAHHVEACAAALVARDGGARPGPRPPLLFVAHTSLEAELPTYAPALVRVAAARAGRALDRVLLRRVDRALAVSPPLASMLTSLGGATVDHLPIPWPTFAPTSERAREHARRALGLERAERLLVYVGNLDRYQGLDVVVDALTLLDARGACPRLLVVTASATARLVAAFAARGLEHRLSIAALDGESSRELAYAAADGAIVPRRAAGGLPVKLLDAMARGVPVVTNARAAAALGLDAGDVERLPMTVARADDAVAMADAIATLEVRCARGDRARRHVAEAHADARCAEAFARCVSSI